MYVSIYIYICILFCMFPSTWRRTSANKCPWQNGQIWALTLCTLLLDHMFHLSTNEATIYQLPVLQLLLPLHVIRNL